MLHFHAAICYFLSTGPLSPLTKQIWLIPAVTDVRGTLSPSQRQWSSLLVSLRYHFASSSLIRMNRSEVSPKYSSLSLLSSLSLVNSTVHDEVPPVARMFLTHAYTVFVFTEKTTDNRNHKRPFISLPEISCCDCIVKLFIAHNKWQDKLYQMSPRITVNRSIKVEQG